MELGLCIEMALSDRSFERRLATASELGLRNVEMWFVDMSYKGSPEKLAELAYKHRVRITNTVIGAPDGKVGGGLTNPAKRAQWLKRAAMSIQFTRRAGIGASIVCTGNTVKGMSDAQTLKSVIEGLKPTVEMAEEAGVTLLLEPLNTAHDHPGYWLTSSDLGAAICRTLKSDRMKLLFDCYHMQIMEGDLLAHIERNLDVIGHIHTAGVPGRNEIYNGEVDHIVLLDRIRRMGYKGVFALEYQPTIAHRKSVEKTLEYIRKGTRS